MRLLSKRKKPTNRVEEIRPRVRQIHDIRRPDSYHYSSRRLGADSEDLKRPSKQTSLKKKTLRAPKRFWIMLAAFGFALVAFSGLSDSPQIIVEGGETKVFEGIDISRYEDSTRKLISANWLNRNKITIDAKKIASDLKREHTELKTVTVEVPMFGSRPKIYIEPSKVEFQLAIGKNNYLLTESGHVIDGSVSEDYVTVVDLNEDDIKMGSQLLPASHIRFLKVVNYQLSRYGYAADYISLPSGMAYEADFRLKDRPYYLKFNLSEKPEEQGGAAVAVLKQLKDNQVKEYIDLRVTGRAYYK